VSQYQKGKTNLDFTEARDSEWQWHLLLLLLLLKSVEFDDDVALLWQWHQLCHMQVCT